MTDEQARPMVPLDGPTAVRLADLTSVLLDLRFVLDLCDRLAPLLQADDDQSDGTLVRGLWTSALIAYSRCFATGKRLGLSEADVAALPGEALQAHEYLRQMRDKHIAHSVNPFEQVKVGAFVGPDDTGQTAVLGVGVLAMTHISGTPEWVQNLRLLAGQLGKRVTELAEATQDQLLREAQQLDIEELQARMPMRATAPHPSGAGDAGG